MPGSLQDQLLKAGLVSEQQLKQSRSKKRKQKRSGDDSTAAAQRKQAAKLAADKRQRDLELNRKRDEEIKRKGEQIAMWQLVRDNRVGRDGGDTAYNFSDGKALKRLYVTGKQHQELVSGTLAIVRHNDFYELVPGAVAEQVGRVDATLVLVHNRDDSGDRDDEYADFKIPDDLMW